MARLWIKAPLAVLADGANGGIVVEDSGIVELVEANARPEVRVDETFDASRHVLLPGLVNTHHHFYQTLTRSHPDALDKPLFGWLEALYPVWARMKPQHLAVATRLALVELMMSGCTTTSDHHYLFPGGLDDALDIQVAEARAVGMRITATRGSMNLSQKDGGLPPDTVVQDHDTIIADCERVVSQYHRPGPGAMVQIGIAPCSPFSVTRELMQDCAELSKNSGCRLHTHLGETLDEEAYCLEKFGCRPLDYLEQTGWLNDRVWLAHGVHFDDGEVARLGQTGVGICHCASSNMVLASGHCRTCELEAAGAPVGLGVDGSASNDASNLMQEVRHALMINRLRYGADKVSHLDVLRWATIGSARCLGRADIGEIAVGKQADLALFRLDELRFSGVGDPLAGLVLSGAHSADRVMIAGKWTVLDGNPVGVDVEQLKEQHSEASRGFSVTEGYSRLRLGGRRTLDLFLGLAATLHL